MITDTALINGVTPLRIRPKTNTGKVVQPGPSPGDARHDQRKRHMAERFPS